MDRQHRTRLDSLDASLPPLHPLRKVPQIKVDHHAAHSVLARPTTVSPLLTRDEPGDLAPHAFDRDDARRADAQFLAAPGREWGPRLEQLDERGRVREHAEVVQDLRYTVVREHRELVDRGPRGEERVRR